jgi:hypothetical protein
MRTIEEKKNIRNAFFFLGLTVLAGVFVLFIGVPILARFTAFISDFRKAGAPITQNDTTPPAPPRFDSQPDATNQKSIKLSGSSEEGSTVKLSLNGNDEEVVSGSDGTFSFDFKLLGGENKYSATAVDTAGNVSQETKVFTIVFDNKEPELSVSSPSDGAQFFGSRQRQITITGSSEASITVTINDRTVSVDNDGGFEYTTTLNEGENKFTVKAVDAAGNETSKELTVTFTP